MPRRYVTPPSQQRPSGRRIASRALKTNANSGVAEIFPTPNARVFLGSNCFCRAGKNGPSLSTPPSSLPWPLLPTDRRTGRPSPLRPEPQKGFTARSRERRGPARNVTRGFQ